MGLAASTKDNAWSVSKQSFRVSDVVYLLFYIYRTFYISVAQLSVLKSAKYVRGDIPKMVCLEEHLHVLTYYECHSGPHWNSMSVA